MRVRRRDKRVWFVLLGIFVAVFLFSFMTQRFKDNEEVEAASLAGFDPGYIISDYQMGNYNSMSEAEIQAFLTAKGNCRDTETYRASYYPSVSYHIKDGHFVCLAEETFGEGVEYGDGVANGVSAAHVIWRAAQDYRINPQVLIVLLQKEQGLITDSWPNDRQYRSATGYGCPDTAPCNAEYYGFKNQVRKAAALFRTVLDGGWTNYPLGNNYVQYNPNAACGGSVVNIRSLATSALYRYTPYQPNAGALAAGYGTAECGAYGNRNFYLYFEDWFGGVTDGKDGRAEIKKYTNLNKTKIGEELSGIICGLSNGGCYQAFSNGYIYWNSDNVFFVGGEIFNRWFKTGTEWGYLKYPISEEADSARGGTKQSFEAGNIYWSEATGAWDVSGGIYQTYLEYGTEWGVLGYPTSSEQRDVNGVVFQTFENGAIYWDPVTGGWTVRDYAREKWQALGGFKSKLGNVTNEGYCGLIKQGCYQAFRTGNIYWSEATGAWDVSGGIYQTYLEYGTEWGVLGYPTSSEQRDVNGVVFQTFENGAIYWDPVTGGSVKMVE